MIRTSSPFQSRARGLSVFHPNRQLAHHEAERRVEKNPAILFFNCVVTENNQRPQFALIRPVNLLRRYRLGSRFVDHQSTSSNDSFAENSRLTAGFTTHP
jgi:hypothetical protein